MKDVFGRNIKELQSKKLFLLDQDGTLYNGGSLFGETPLFLEEIKKHGGRYIFITNNSSKSVSDYVKKMISMGIKTDECEFFTSSQATAIYLNETYPGKKVYCVGTASLQAELKAAGIKLVNHHEAEIALIGYDTELNYQKLHDICELLTLKDVPFIATNPDWVCPIDFGYVPDCGSFCFMITKATGKEPFYIGKPRPAMIDIITKKLGIAKEDTVVIGDRLYTDILSAFNAHVTSVCVLTGEAKLSDITDGLIKPDYTLKSIGDIFKK